MARRWLQSALLVLAWGLLIFIAVATLGPRHWRPSLPFGLGPQVERFLGFFVLCGFFALAYPKNLRIVGAGGVVLAVGLELAQWLVPGRDPGFWDAVAKASGALAAVLIAAAFRYVMPTWGSTDGDPRA